MNKMSSEQEETYSSSTKKTAAELQSTLVAERAVLCDPKADLVRRLEALYHLKTSAFEVHPRIVDADNERLPSAALERHRKVLAAAAAESAGNNKKQHQHAEDKDADKEKSEQATTEVASSAAAAVSASSAGCIGDEHEVVSFVVDAYHAAIDTTDSVLLQHELLYNLGQLGARRSIQVCLNVVKNVQKYSEVSRHEAIEAIGAIGFPEEAVPALQATLAALPKEGLTLPITESAELAFQRLELVKKYGQAHVLREHAHRDFVSVDPAPPNGMKDLKELRALLLDPKADMFARYQAMFQLRNINTTQSVQVLCDGLVHDTSSCLFRHEVAFVLGQMEYSSSIPALKHALLNEAEHGMVRHEAAEALGAIGNEECKALLTEYLKHDDKLVRDSCYAALQLMDDGHGGADVTVMKYGDNVEGHPTRRM